MIQGHSVFLRPARPDELYLVYRWLAASDSTASMLGAPLFPDAPVPTWDEFRADYRPLFAGTAPDERSFIIESGGTSVGHVNYCIEERDGRRWAELDIWMSGDTWCGRGCGSDALTALVEHLHREHEVREFILRPSARNVRAIAAYQKAGFTRLPLTNDEQAVLYGPGDYYDTVVMQRVMEGE